MSAIAKNALFAVGAIALFGISYYGFSLATGKPVNGLTLVHTPEATTDAKKGTAAGVRDPETTATVQTPAKPAPTSESAKAAVSTQASASVLGAFVMPAPFSSEELSELQGRLRERIADADARLAKIQARASELDERERALEGRAKEIAEQTAKLDARDKEIRMRLLEIERDEVASGERDAKSWKDLTKFFQEGDADELAKKLATFEPKDGAKILRELDDERAGAILNALPTDKYKAFLDAYRKQVH